jgi:hypothetical protein
MRLGFATPDEEEERRNITGYWEPFPFSAAARQKNRLPELQPMIGSSLITREKVAVLRYGATTSGQT